MKVCAYCEGSGYNIDGEEYLLPNWRDNVTNLGDVFATCPQCEGTGFTEESERFINFRVEIDIRCSEDAYFPQEIRDAVNRMNWGYDDSPRQGDYLLHLISTKFSEFRDFGIFADRMAIGKYGSVSTITHLPSEVDERPSFLKDDQPTLFDTNKEEE